LAETGEQIQVWARGMDGQQCEHDNLDDATLDAMIQSSAATIRLTIPPEYWPGTRENLRSLLAVARTLIETDKPARPVVEIAPVFRA
jgi:hypothetical protein